MFINCQRLPGNRARVGHVYCTSTRKNGGFLKAALRDDIQVASLCAQGLVESTPLLMRLPRFIDPMYMTAGFALPQGRGLFLSGSTPFP